MKVIYISMLALLFSSNAFSDCTIENDESIQIAEEFASTIDALCDGSGSYEIQVTEEGINITSIGGKDHGGSRGITTINPISSSLDPRAIEGRQGW